MRVLRLASTWEGPTSGDPWRQPSPTWREEGNIERNGEHFPKRQVEVVEVTARGTPFMAPSGGELDGNIMSSDYSGNHSLQGIWKNCASIRLEESGPELLLVMRLMAMTRSKVGASFSAKGNSGRARRRLSMGNSEQTKTDSSDGGRRKMSPGERRFTMENSIAEHRALFRLKKELEATLLFQHGKKYRANPNWVTRILLSRLFRERLSLSSAVKSFAKFQRREMMRGLVKLNELEDVAEPPFGGN